MKRETYRGQRQKGIREGGWARGDLWEGNTLFAVPWGKKKTLRTEVFGP